MANNAANAYLVALEGFVERYLENSKALRFRLREIRENPDDPDALLVLESAANIVNLIEQMYEALHEDEDDDDD